jgi:hypothetical protein
MLSASPLLRDIVGFFICVVVFAIALWLDRKQKIGKTVIDRATLALAIAAIVYAMIQFHESGQQGFMIEKQANRLETQTGKLNEQNGELEVIQEEMSTRSAGFFPSNMKDISEVVARARAKLDVMTDYVGYGHYSAPEDFENYLRAIQNLRGKSPPVPIRMLIYNRSKATEIQDKQFTERDFKKEMGSPNFVRFCNKFNSGKPCPKTKQEFDNLLFHRQQDYIEDLLERGVEISVTGHELPFYFWNADDSDVVFSFLNTGEKGTREVSFRTREPKIINDAFKDRFNSILRASETRQLHVLSRNPDWHGTSPVDW